ncbi:DUF4398 domain-containing protein [Pseudomonas sp. CAU 1711]|uniref:DUF4398 domain-containing protein n=1 Tax=Pseudomonas sp. CAU 1711 TaxID=3140356 RepID=UPI003261BFAC
MNHHSHAAGQAAHLPLLGLFGGLLLLSACAAPPMPPEQALRAAESAIARAEQGRASDFAATELGMARDKLAAANSAVGEEDMPQAERLAVQSRAEAELALARAQAGRAQKVNEEMLDSTDSLKQEMQRNTGAAQ